MAGRKTRPICQKLNGKEQQKIYAEKSMGRDCHPWDFNQISRQRSDNRITAASAFPLNK